MSAPNPRRLRQRIAAALLGIGLAASIALIALIAQAAAPPGRIIGEAAQGQRFTLIRWELEHVFNRWIAIPARLVYDEPQCDAPLTLARLSGVQANRAQANEAQVNGAQCVERALERAISEAVGQAGLATPLPLFRSQRIVWPPLDIELERAPRVLAVSPRSEVRLAASTLLSPELRREEYGRIEAAIETGGEWSAWIGGVGGVATYPALIIPRADWYDALRLAAHEWLHHYLIFHPLGRAYFASDEMRTINETVADIAGDELGALALGAEQRERAAAELDDAGEHPAAATLRELRLEVDALLAEGQVEEAEARMEAVRRQLAAEGINYRRINQAFFAFRGGYAGRPEAVSPYGPLLQALRGRSVSLAAFVHAVRGVDSVVAADALLGVR